MYKFVRTFKKSPKSDTELSNANQAPPADGKPECMLGEAKAASLIDDKSGPQPSFTKILESKQFSNYFWLN